MEQNQIIKPPRIEQAIRLVYITLGIGVLRLFLEPSLMGESPSLGFAIFVLAFTFAIMWLLVVMIGKGRNWARVTFLILLILGLPLSVAPLIQSFNTAPISGLLGLAQYALQITAAIFLFQRSSSHWFKEMKVLRKKQRA